MRKKPECIFYNNDTLLESPCYDSVNSLLYFVSINEHIVYQMNLKTKEVKKFITDSPVGCVGLKNDGTVVEAEYSGIYSLDFLSGKKKLLAHPNQDKEMRYNDGKFDARGRFLVGTKGYQKEYENRGKLFSVSQDSSKTLIENVTISNGLAFSPDNKILYYIDTMSKKIAKYIYNIESGDVRFVDYIYEFPADDYPDGMCSDGEGNLWVAVWNGSRVVKINPTDSALLEEIKLPVRNVSSCTLVNNCLYITTAKSETQEKFAGGLFKAEL